MVDVNVVITGAAHIGHDARIDLSSFDKSAVCFVIRIQRRSRI